MRAEQIVRQVVAQPVPGPGQDFRLPGADLLLQLAHDRGLGRFARIDPALGHLPGVPLVIRGVDPVAQKHESPLQRLQTGGPEALAPGNP